MMQHFELRDLQFEDAQGLRLSTHGSVRLVLWPQSLSVTADLGPGVDYADGWFTGSGGQWLVCDQAAVDRSA